MPGPLGHIRVLDLSRVLAGPWATQFLADMGADVVKVERPKQGDDTRTWGPPWLVEPTDKDPGLSAYTIAANRGKRSVTIDFTTPEGQALVRKLAEKADVVVENYKVGGLKKYGLDADSLRAINPRLVYCSVTGFGQTGPYAKRAGYDFLIQAMSGLMSITGQPDGAPGAEPMKIGVAMSDLTTGLYATAAILTALVKRDHTGEGETIDVALLDCQIAALANQASNYLVSGKAPVRMGNRHPNVVPYQVFATADGHIILAVGNDAQFAKFCKAAGLDAVGADPRFTRNVDRVINRDALTDLLGGAIAGRTSADWIALLEQHGVPCGPINDIEAVFADPHVKARGLQRDYPDDRAGTIPQVGNPVKFASTDTTAPTPPPYLGQHAREVLTGELGLTDAEIADLKAKGVL
ncbi:CaiB/BaiF CoA transferase family protein [Futiania mangrovi]|uniref:CoA transferase n=1 Tax=Futiania mangrovi TaxID=2959716 RepID=A0A9J6PKP6_9PROT|nr:CaiB/BaiF CoA-transferase family protein [Futiania mangrovii]MCP1336642.1 CoA transferase [Futiania mangrovii]